MGTINKQIEVFLNKYIQKMWITVVYLVIINTHVYNKKLSASYIAKIQWIFDQDKVNTQKKKKQLRFSSKVNHFFFDCKKSWS